MSKATRLSNSPTPTNKNATSISQTKEINRICFPEPRHKSPLINLKSSVNPKQRNKVYSNLFKLGKVSKEGFQFSDPQLPIIQQNKINYQEVSENLTEGPRNFMSNLDSLD